VLIPNPSVPSPAAFQGRYPAFGSIGVRTAAEIAAGVTPTADNRRKYPEGDNRRYASVSDWINVLSQGVEGHMWSDMTTAAMVTATGDIVIYVHGRRSIRASAAMVNLLRTQGRCTIDANGELLLDGDGNVTGACLHYENYFPNLRNVRFLDAALGGAGGTASYDGNAYGPAGDVEWHNVIAENCTDCGWSIRGKDDVTVTGATSASPIVMELVGHGFSTGNILDFDEWPGDFAVLNGRRFAITVTDADHFSVAVDGSAFGAYSGDAVVAKRESRVTLYNCQTKGTTGSGNFAGSGIGFLYHAAGLLSYARWGGVFTGDADARSTDGFKCSHAEVHGGWHDKVARGPTVGFNTHLFVVQGACASDMTENAFSADTTDGVNQTVGVGTITGCVASRASRAVRTTSSYVAVNGCFSYQCTNAGAHFVAAGDGVEVIFGGNYAYRTEGGDSFTAFGAVESATITLGVNGTNSTSRQSVSAPTSLSATVRRMVADGLVREVSADTDVRGNDRILYVDTTAGGVDIDLPAKSEVSGYGRELSIIHKNGTNAVNITFQGGAADGETVNGTTGITFYASQTNRELRLQEVEPGVWKATSGLNFLQSASQVWDPASLASSGTPLTTNVAVTGAAAGDFAVASLSSDLLGCDLRAEVTAADTVKVTLTNSTGAAQNVASGTLRVLVWRKLG
jgi:hypothetical protein